MEGWIKLYRKIVDDELYFSERFDKTHAWIDLLVLAEKGSRSFVKRGIVVEVGPGDVAISLRDLAGRWQWSVNTVRSFLDLLELIHRIEIRKSNIINVITILNWSKYQSVDTQTDTQVDTQIDTQTDTHLENIRSKEIKKEDNNKLLSKKESLASMMSSSKNTEYIAFGGWLIRNAPNCLQGCYPIKPLTEEQYTILRDDKGKYALGKQELCDYILSIENNVTYLKKYKSMYLTIANWSKRDGKLKSN